jgi:hypothetical protein
MSIDLHTKYLKYKTKYLELKKILELKKPMIGGFNEEINQTQIIQEERFRLNDGYIISPYVVSTVPEPAHNKTTPIRCIYTSSEFINIAFIPKIGSDLHSSLALLISSRNKRLFLPVEIENLINTEYIINRDDSNYRLEYTEIIPDFISFDYMKKLYRDGLVDLASKLVIDNIPSNKYYILSDEAYEESIFYYEINTENDLSRLRKRYDTIEKMHRSKANILNMMFVDDPNFPKYFDTPEAQRYLQAQKDKMTQEEKEAQEFIDNLSSHMQGNHYLNQPVNLGTFEVPTPVNNEDYDT